MGEIAPKPADLFIEGVKVYSTLGSHIVDGLGAYMPSPPRPGLNVEQMSETDVFISDSDKLFRRIAPWGSSVDRVYESTRDSFLLFKEQASLCYPDNGIIAMLNQKYPMSRLVDAGGIGELNQLLNEDPAFDLKKLNSVMQFMFLSETGRLDIISNLSEDERQRLSDEYLNAIINSQAYLAQSINDLVAREVIAEMPERDIFLNEVQVEYQQDSPPSSRMKLLYRPHRGENGQTSLNGPVYPQATVVVVKRELMVIKDHANKPEAKPISKHLESFVLACLRKANTKLMQLDQLPESKQRRVLHLV